MAHVRELAGFGVSKKDFGRLQASQRAIFMTPAPPDWIRRAIEEAGSQLDQPIRGSGGMGSDHLVFLQAGVPATNIAAIGGKRHTLEDTPDSPPAPSSPKSD